MSRSPVSDVDEEHRERHRWADLGVEHGDQPEDDAGHDQSARRLALNDGQPERPTALAIDDHPLNPLSALITLIAPDAATHGTSTRPVCQG